jgi:hypothetical protein
LRRPQRVVKAEEEPCLSARRDGPESPLTPIAIHGEAAIIEEAAGAVSCRRAVAESLLDDAALGARQVVLGTDPLEEFVDEGASAVFRLWDAPKEASPPSPRAA